MPASPLIRLGHAGPAVVDVQQRLRRLGVVDVPTSGTFDDATHAAVRHFQRERRLSADGIVGPDTWRALVDAGYSLGNRLLVRASPMLRGDDVRDLQARLNALGFDAGPEDGLFGPLAQGAVEEFQRNVGLVVDGVAGPRTVEALRRVRRDHQSGGVGVAAREKERLRTLTLRGLPGARIIVDPTNGPDDPGPSLLRGGTVADLTWALATRVAARLDASGAEVLLARGPTTTPSPSDRARLANEAGADLVLSIGLGVHTTAAACGASAYHYGSASGTSAAGQRLAGLVLDSVVAAGWGPDGHVHPMTWSLLRETRMPAAVVEPAFASNPAEVARLLEPPQQDLLAAAMARGVARCCEPE